MAVKMLDHVNVRTANLDTMVAFYEAVLGAKSGPRPEFQIPGAWLYIADHPCVHLVHATEEPGAREKLALQHFAFVAEDKAAFLAKLEAQGVAYWQGQVPGFGITQVNFHDPDGNHIHVDFRE